MLFLAMSCLQARLQDRAFDELVALAPDGIQLTPGNLPVPGFRERALAWGGALRVHHGFAWDRYRRAVYDRAHGPLIDEHDRSIHPPHPPADAPEGFAARWLADAAERDLLLETMYPGHVLGTGAELALAMDLGIRLAVDVSHLHIQRTAGALSAAVERRVLAYERIAEIHVSANDGRSDRHAPVTAETPGLAWARERGRNLPLVLECYMHRLTADERRRQVEGMRDLH
jgi:hypothetical protein